MARKLPCPRVSDKSSLSYTHYRQGSIKAGLNTLPFIQVRFVKKAHEGTVMGGPIRILYVEDSPDDAELVIHSLVKAGWEPEFERVKTAEGMRRLKF